MILSLLFTALAAYASEPAASVIKGVIDLNEKIQMNSCQCDASPYQIASTDHSDKNMCEVIASFAKGDPKRFDPKNPYGLCAPTWKSPTPEWRRPEVQRELQTYATSDFVAVPRTDFMKSRGYEVYNEKGRADLIAQTRAIQATSAKACCGADAECSQTMMRVRVSVCSSAADQDPMQPDSCEAVAGSYNLTARENAVMALSMKNSLGLSATMNQMQVRKAIDEAKALIGDNLMLERFPVEGEIILSPYLNLKKGQPISELGTLHHEFGHACSFIKRQIAAKSGKPASEENAMSFFQMRGMGCEIDDHRQTAAYGSLLKEAGADQNVELCLIDLAKQSTVETSVAYIANSCQANKIEEATAEAFAYYTLPLKPDSHPDRACERRPSKVHPASVDVFTCVIKADPRKRRELASKFNCQGVR